MSQLQYPDVTSTSDQEDVFAKGLREVGAAIPEAERSSSQNSRHEECEDTSLEDNERVKDLNDLTENFSIDDPKRGPDSKKRTFDTKEPESKFKDESLEGLVFPRWRLQQEPSQHPSLPQADMKPAQGFYEDELSHTSEAANLPHVDALEATEFTPADSDILKQTTAVHKTTHELSPCQSKGSNMDVTETSDSLCSPETGILRAVSLGQSVRSESSPAHGHECEGSDEDVLKVPIQEEQSVSDETSPNNDQLQREELQEDVLYTEDDGWANFNTKDLIRLRGTIMMYDEQPIQPGKDVYHGRMENVSGQKGRLAVKLLKKEICDFKEIDDLKKLKAHDNIVKIMGSGSCNYGVHKMFIAMEYCPHNLYEYIEKYPFHLVKATTFFQQTVSAIAFIHDHEMAHRDLKPSNILVTIDNSSIKVADFGICKQIPGDRSQVTVTNPRAGTEGFKAPETYKDGIKRLGYKSDIFPLGICGYYTITHGQHPFGPDSFKWPGNIVSNENRDLSGVPAILGDHKKSQLISLLERMLKYNPGDRPTAQNVEDDIFFKGFLEVEKGSKLECSYDHTSGKPDSQTDPPPSEEEINVVQDEVRNMEPENPSSTNASNATKPKQVSSEEEPCIVDTAAFDSDDPPGTLQTHNEASNSQAALNIRVTESDSVAFSTHSEPARAGANPGKSPHPQINEKSSNLGFLEVQKSSLLKRSCDHTTCKPDSQTDPSPSKEDPTVVQDEIRDTESENSNSTNARKAMKPKQVSFADDADTAAFDSDDPPGTLQTHNEASNPQAASTESDSAAFSTHSEPARSGENPDSCAASSKKTLSCVHSDILNKDGRYIIKNQMYYDEEKLLVYCVFWIGDINHSKLPKHHSESCLTEVAVNLSDTLHFTMKTGVKDYYLVVTGSLKLSYFNDCKQKTFQRRVDPSPDNIPNKFINIDYHMWVEGKEPQNVFMRFSNLEKHERIGQLCEKCRKKTGEDSSRVVDRSVHIHHGDVSMVVGDIAESGGVINKTTHDGQSFNTASKGPK